MFLKKTLYLQIIKNHHCNMAFFIRKQKYIIGILPDKLKVKMKVTLEYLKKIMQNLQTRKMIVKQYKRNKNKEE